MAPLWMYPEGSRGVYAAASLPDEPLWMLPPDIPTWTAVWLSTSFRRAATTIEVTYMVPMSPPRQ